MRNAAMLMEKVLNDTVNKEKYRVLASRTPSNGGSVFVFHSVPGVPIA